MLKTIKEFIEYRKSLQSGTIDITPEMQRQLDAFDYKTMQCIVSKTLEILSREMIAGDLSADYVRGAKFALTHFKKNFNK